MTTQEANRIITEYMDENLIVPVNINELSDSQKKTYQPYIYNLDALVPVWEKVGKLPNLTEWSGTYSCEFQIPIGKGFKYKEVGVSNLKCKTIQEAACIATAKAIKEL